MILNLNVDSQQLIRDHITLKSPRLIMPLEMAIYIYISIYKPLENEHVLKAKGLCVCVYACMYIQAIRKHVYNS